MAIPRLLATLIALGAAAAAGAAPLNVPGDFASVQEALDAAQEGDVVMLAPGTYEGTLTLRGGISLVGMGNRPEDTVISGGYLHKVMALVGDARPLFIQNLTLMDGFSGYGGAITLDGADVEFYGVHFVGNTSAEEGGALFALNSHLSLRNCLFYANYALGGGGGAVHIQGNDPLGRAQLIENCTFAGNSGCCGGTSLVMDGTTIAVSHNILEDVNCLPGTDATFTCNNGAVCGTDGGHNFIDDPLYCGFEYVDCRLEADSPCLPENNPDCGLIGAFKACSFTATKDASFSAVKAYYR